MKTKNLFLMAAMLLASMCTCAQSKSNEPLKGDVNGDGKVDVADITAIIAIIMENGGTQTTYYWGVLTEEQLTDQTFINNLSYNQHGEKPTKLTIPSYTQNQGSYVVFIYPSNWGTPTIVDSIGYGTGNMPATEAEINNPQGKVLNWWVDIMPNAEIYITWK